MAKKIRIVHKPYFDGKLQSVSFEVDGKKVEGTGAVLPGEYDCGKAGPKETITVTSGSLIINGKLYTTNVDRDTNRPIPCIIEPGEKINIKAEEKSTYHCLYG